MRKKNYLNNRDILKEIHKSKATFCSFVDPSYNQYDLIIDGVEVTLVDLKNNPSLINQAKENKAKRLSLENYEARREAGEKVKQADCEVDPNSITKEELIFRLMTFEHIPEEPGRKKNPKTIADTKIKLNFPPFQHWKFDSNGELELVGKSHWKGDLDTGKFSKDHGKVTQTLAIMWMKLCERYATKGNVRGYTYNDEMRGQAILQLTQIGLQFDESKSDNPFAYYTAAVTNSFVRVINIEKRNQNIRDDILEINNLNPSYTRQHAGEWQAEVKRHGLDKD